MIDPVDEEYLNFDQWFGDDDKIALQVHGDSMSGDNIDDGDYVVIDRRKPAENGMIAAIRNAEGEAILRHFHRMKDGQLRLESSDGKARTIVPGDTEVIGVLVGVVRKY